MVQSIDNGFNRANYSAVKININKPEVFANGANNQNPVVTNPMNVNGNNADLNAVNMAQVVKDGMHIKIPEKGKAGAGKNSSGTAGNASRPDNKEDNGGNLVNINTADAQALTKIKGIGPAMAQKIIDYRESNGSFQSVEELQKVKGIGPGKYAKIQGQVTI